MKIYFDESGQSGCLLQREDLLNFREQPTFAIGALVVKNEKDEEKILQKYHEFKQKFNITKEIKGSDLLTKKYNEELNYILNNIVDSTHYYVLIYDKKFYISTLLLVSLLGFEYKQEMPIHFYQQAFFLAKQKDDFFLQYLKYIEEPTIDKFNIYLKFLVNYDYAFYDLNENAVVDISLKILQDNIESKFNNDFMTFGWYKNPKVTNLINLNALAEIIYFIKNQLKLSNSNIQYIHDNLKEFEETFDDELKKYNINILFKDSKKEEMLQIIDNIVSIFRHSYDKMIYHLNQKEEFKECSEWDMKLVSKIQRKLTNRHINYTIPLSDWAATLCIQEMYSLKFPKKYRNKFVFNSHYIYNLKLVYQSILESMGTIENVYSILDE